MSESIFTIHITFIDTTGLVGLLKKTHTHF